MGFSKVPTGGYGIISRRAMRRKGPSASAKGLYGLLCSYTGDKEYCYPSIETQAADLETSTASIKRWQKELIAAGLLDKDKLTPNGWDRRNKYYPMVPDEDGPQGLTGEPLQGGTGEPNNQRADEPIEGATHEPVIITGNNNTGNNNKTDIHPFDSKVQGMPAHIAALLEKYRVTVQDFGHIGRLMVPVDCAIALVGPQIVADAIAQVIEEAPSIDKKFRVTNIKKLLGDEQRLRERAARFTPEAAEPEKEKLYLSDPKGLANLVEIKKRTHMPLTDEEIEACKKYEIAVA